MSNEIDKFEIKGIAWLTENRYAIGAMLHEEIIPRPLHGLEEYSDTMSLNPS